MWFYLLKRKSCSEPATTPRDNFKPAVVHWFQRAKCLYQPADDAGFMLGLFSVIFLARGIGMEPGFLLSPIFHAKHRCFLREVGARSKDELRFIREGQLRSAVGRGTDLVHSDH